MNVDDRLKRSESFCIAPSPNRWDTLFKRIQDWPDMEIEAAINATSDAIKVDLEAAFGGTAEEIVI